MQSEVNAYIDSIMILSSLREHLRDVGIPAYIEKKVDKKHGGHKTPDLMVCSNNHLFVDHKYTESSCQENLTDRIKKMEKYNSTFIFNSNEFTPEVVMLVPDKAVDDFEQILGCPITWGYDLEEEVTIEQRVGTIADSEVLKLFNPALVCSRAKAASKYKFIISHAPLPYTALQVYALLWNLHPPSDYFGDFSVDFEIILETFNHVFPPWLSTEVKQLNIKRIAKSLTLLADIGWVKWIKAERKVIVSKSKGRLSGNTLSDLIDHHAEKEYNGLMKKYQQQQKELKELEKDFDQKELGDYLNSSS